MSSADTHDHSENHLRRWVIAVISLLFSAIFGTAILPMLMFSSVSDPTLDACGTSSTALPGGARSAPTDPAVLVEAQARNAKTIVAVGEQMNVPAQGIIIALATASQESAFRMLANDGTDKRLRPEQKDVSRSLQFPNDGVGNDHGSVNMFQQQYPWWGTLEELMDPQRAAMKFYERLLKLQGWESMPVTVAAQTVQGSAFPDAYAQHEVMARRIYAEHQGAGESAPALPESSNTQVGANGSSPVAAGKDVLCGSGTALDCPASTDTAVVNAEKGLTPDALRVIRCLAKEFGPRTWSTIGDRPASVDRDHQEGRAVDAMVENYTSAEGKALGQRMADWVVAHADALGVKYVIWDAKIWTRQGDGVGKPGSWGPYTHPDGNTNDTVAHRDHVHVSVYGSSAGTAGGGSHAGEGVRLPIDPDKYTISSYYGPRDGAFHAGLDFAANSGTPLYAVTGGKVTQASDKGDGYGNCVRIVDGATETLYAHQVDGAITVKVGDTVAAGAPIGAVGSTGDSSGPHLHFEVRIDGKATDPVPYLTGLGLDPDNPTTRSD